METLDAFVLGLRLGALPVPSEPVHLDVEVARAWLRGAQVPDGRPFTALERGVGGAHSRVALGIVGSDGTVRAARWVRLAALPAWLVARHADTPVVTGWP